MNKLLTKIVGAALGAAMAIGVGVAVAAGNSKEASPVYAATGDSYTRVTDASKLANGDTIIIVCESKNDALSTTQNKNNRGKQAITISNHTTSFVDGVQDIALSGSSTAWVLTAGSVQLSGVSGQNYLKDGSDTWTIAINSSTGVATITSAASGRVIKRNTSSDLYATYSSGQTDVQIYKKDAAKTLSSIAITTAPTKTTYYVGDSFDSTGMVVTATYSDSSSGNVTASCTFSPATFSSTGSQNVTVSYTEGGVTRTATQAVTVNAARTITGVTLSGDMTNKSYKDGDEWDVSGLYLSVTWSSGDPTTVQLAALTKDTDYLMDPDSASEGDTSVDIEGEYEGFSFSKTVTGITVSALPDVINQAFTGVTGSSYTDWSGKNGSSGSGAVYAGNSSAGTDVQLRVQNPSGIWTTASGGVFSGIEVTWNASTGDSRSIEVYGKNTAYASGDLYSNNTNTKGTLIGSIAKGDSTISGDLGDYQFIGIKANGGALYLTEIDIYWTPASPEMEYTAGGTTSSLHVMNGSTNTVTFEAKNFDSVTAGIFSNTPTNENSSYANLAYSVSGTTVTVTATGKAVGEEPFTISATGCATTLTLNVTVQASTTFDSLDITTASSATVFNEDDPFAVTSLVVTANYTIGGSPSTVEFSAAEGNLDQLTYTVGGNVMEIGDSLTSTGTLAVVVSYTDSTTGTTRSASSYNITVNAYVAHTWTKVTSAPADWRGTYLLGYEKDGTAYFFNSGLETFDVVNNNVNTTNISGNVVTGSKTIDAAAVKIERNKVSSTSYYHAKCANGEYLKSASKSINHQQTATAAVAITFDGVSLKIGDYWLRFNTANDQLRFRFGDSSYLSSSTASLYKMDVTSAVNTEVSNFVSGFDSAIGGVCDDDGINTNVSSLNSAWTAQANAFKSLSVDAQGILANTTYTHDSETAGSIKDIVDRYDYVYGKYSVSLTKGDFMNRSDAGTLVSYSSTRISPIASANNAIVMIISITSAITLTAVGAYFLLRKRKEH